ncbi:hypothetical protein CS063_14675 [Sporanaerobium hydrogeniformans]|uniref:Uncharacterized protein n=1 Tax=Sporanaerobium hydrogeniformans TaxID=3072179 RepID=A0AC61D882_9FIRM|nr:sensor histidine kinase [Sporanaerobium hydrogeniformans]PHV69664.1 hypothetical protein CS063_14675 [Sporanaerobium hydrogeniformans]
MQTKVLLEKWREKQQHIGIKNRILLMVSGLIVLCLLVASGIFIGVFGKNIRKEHIIYTQKLLNHTNSQLNNYFDELGAIANEANYNYYLQNYLIAEKQNEQAGDYRYQLSKEYMKNFEMSLKLFSYPLNSRSDVSTVMIFGKERLLLKKSIYSSLNLIKDYSQYEWYQKAVANPQQLVILGPSEHDFLVGNTEPNISLSKVISSYEDGTFLGVILIDINLNRITEICNAVYNSNGGDLWILNEKGEVVYTQGELYRGMNDLREPKLITAINSALEKTKRDDFTIWRNGVKYQAVYRPILGTEWKLVHMTSIPALTNSMYKTTFFIVLLVMLLLIIIILVLNSLLIEIVKPIIHLKEHMDLADEGNLDVTVEIFRNDETGMLAKSFNGMLKRIKNLMAEVVNEQEDKRKYELQALQAQINPHFLYNTLDSIIWMAEAQNKNIVPMTEALAKLFRISLNRGSEFIGIQDELEHVRNYLIIQSMRYVDKFEYTITLSDEVRYCKTIKLILQPIVENCIYHGIKKKRGKGHVSIIAYKKADYLKVKITDDGNGMNENMCKDILVKASRFDNSSGSGIGVKNVNERIKLYFGEEYGITYTSELGVGTTAILTLPIIEQSLG